MNTMLLKTALLGPALALALSSGGAQAAKFHVLYFFGSVGGDGIAPESGLIRDRSHDLLGVTTFGGADDKGTVFAIRPDGTEDILHTFTNTPDGSLPRGTPAADKAGNLYLTTQEGGSNGLGAVIKIAPDGTESVLHSFAGGSDGSQPNAGVIADKQGNLYGTTVLGGGGCDCGTLFRTAPDGSTTILHSFAGADGFYPVAAPIRDKAGNFYGTTGNGGASGFGVVFKIASDGTETVLHSFAGSGDGATPWTKVLQDDSGNLYGTTTAGGASGDGVAFKLAPDGTYTVLHSFAGGSDGRFPNGGLTLGHDGNFYGTTVYGGRNDLGTIFAMTPAGSVTILHAFHGKKDGAAPAYELLQNKKGNLYGTASGGGPVGAGVAFRLKR